MTIIQMRRGTAADWTAANPVLASGEQGLETDTGKLKIGNGTSAWAVLPYHRETIVLDNAASVPAGTPNGTLVFRRPA